MKIVRLAMAFAVTILTGVFSPFAARAQTTAPVEAHNVVLVHGAWADGSSWAGVIPYLQAAGLKVTAVQNPLTSLEDSVAATRRALALQDGPTVLVAHSWGGTVISEAGIDPKVTALVYVAPRAAPTPERTSSRSPESFPPGRYVPASRNMTVSPNCPRSPSSNISQMASSPGKQRCFMPCRSRPRLRCSADEPQRRPGARNLRGMRCRSSIRPSIPTWSDSWQSA